MLIKTMIVKFSYVSKSKALQLELAKYIIVLKFIKTPQQKL